MKTIIINKLLCMEVSNSIGLYAFKELKANKTFRNLDILKSFCSLTKQINSDENKDDDKGYIEVYADENVTEYLPSLIAKYIFDEITDYEEPNFEWLMEMMSIHDQLEDDDSDAVKEIKNNTVYNGEDPAQDIKTNEDKTEKITENAETKNKDVIEQLNKEITVENEDIDSNEVNLDNEYMDTTELDTKEINNDVPAVENNNAEEYEQNENTDQSLFDDPEEEIEFF